MHGQSAECIQIAAIVYAIASHKCITRRSLWSGKVSLFVADCCEITYSMDLNTHSIWCPQIGGKFSSPGPGNQGDISARCRWLFQPKIVMHCGKMLGTLRHLTKIY